MNRVPLARMKHNIKVLLISILPNSHRNLSILSLHAFLKKAGLDVIVLFIPNRQEYRGDLLKKFIRDHKFNLVGISCMTEGFRFAKVITQDIKEEAPQSIVVWGGVHPTLRPEECLPYADCVCVGEGEEMLLALAERLSESKDFSNLPGIAILSSDRKPIINLQPPLIDINTLPLITYDWLNFYIQDADGLVPFDRNKYCAYSNYRGEDYTLMSSRGCPFNCSYCCNSSLKSFFGRGYRVRRRSVESVIQECKQAISNIGTIRFINFMDEQFLVSREWTKEFAEKYSKEINLPFIVQLHPGTFNEEMIQLLRDAGLKFAIMGIQSGSKATNQAIFHRPFNEKALVEASRILSKQGIYVYYDVILENELETEQDRDDTVKLLLKLQKPFSLTFYALTPFPGTDLEKMYKDNNIASRTDPYEQGYKDLNEEDFYFQICSIIPYTPKWLAEQIFFKHKRNGFFRFMLKSYFKMTKTHRSRVKTAQEKNQRHGMGYKYAKRIFDLICSFIGLVILSPILIVISLIIKSQDGGSIFYRGERVGLYGKIFRIFKFRTMIVNADKIGSLQTSYDDPRFTKTGRFLRKYKIDELPQLINVLLGEMSLVGPRPEVKMCVDMMSDEERKTILSVKPGMTDWASLWNFHEEEVVKGSPDPEKTYIDEIWPEKKRLQIKYVKEQTFLGDIIIIIKTIAKLF